MNSVVPRTVRLVTACLLVAGILCFNQLNFTSRILSEDGVGEEYGNSVSSPQRNGTPAGGQESTKQSSSPVLSKYPVCTNAVAGREPYVCAGPRYEKFADKLEQFILWSHDEENTLESFYRSQKEFQTKTRNVKSPRTTERPLWGRRLESPFPANSTILAVGSSHTRSIFLSLACQYPLLLDEEVIPDETAFPVRRGSYYRFEFSNHAKLHLITNHDMFYHKDWQQQLEDLVEYKLEDFDALFYGRFNDLKWTDEQDGTEHVKVGTTLTTFAKTYPGPIVAHTLMAEWFNDGTSLKTLNSQRWNMKKYWPERARALWVLDGQHYMDALGYCSTDEWRQAGTCESDMSKHACMGARGGHSDLMAWDMLEAVYEMWRRTKAKANGTTKIS